jgi:hypothetical protein
VTEAEALELLRARGWSDRDVRMLVDSTFGDHEAFCRRLKIRDKDGILRTPDWSPSWAKLTEAIERQRRQGKPVRGIILKGRQVHFSAGCCTHVFKRCAFMPGQHGRIFCDLHKNAANLYGYLKTYADYYQSAGGIRPLGKVKGRADEKLIWPAGSWVEFSSAERATGGRSASVRRFIGDEFAFWRAAEQLMTGALNSVPDDPDTMVLLPSTANGAGGPFFERWQTYSAPDYTGDWFALFFAWWEHPENTRAISDMRRFQDSLTQEEIALARSLNLKPEQLHWRRWAIANKCEGSIEKFNQEHPACLTGEIRVSTERGIIPISEAFGTHHSESGRIRAWGPQPISTVYKLTTKRGRVIRGTFDHPVSTPDGFIYLSRLQPGQKIHLRAPRFASGPYLTHSWEIIPGAMGQVTIDENWGALLGYFMGDGSWHKDTISVVTDEKDPDVADHVALLLSQLIGDPQRRTIRRVKGRKGMTELRLGCKPARRVFRELGLLYRNDGGEGSWKRRVCVPECIFRSPESVVQAFLQTLFECDGSASQNKVRFGSCKLDFVRDVQLLLLGFGCNSRIFSQPKKAGNGVEYQFYSLELGVEASRVFHDRIGFVGARKRALRPVETHLGCPPEPNDLTDEVLSIERQGEEITYDLTVEPDHVFSANGILTHNTPEEAFISSGRPRFCHISLGRMVQSRDAITGHLERVRVGMSERLVFAPRDDGRGELRVFKRPAPGRHYVIGADPAEGIDVRDGIGTSDPDYTDFYVADQDTGEQVACFHARLEPDPAGEAVCALGEWYNWAYIVPEVNSVGLAFVQAILYRDYPVHLIYHRERDPDDRRPPMLQELGWKETAITRQQLISIHDRMIRELAIHIVCPHCQSEHRTFVVASSGRAEHQEGCHDDAVFAGALASVGLQTAPRIRALVEARKPKPVDWDDEDEDDRPRGRGYRVLRG